MLFRSGFLPRSDSTGLSTERGKKPGRDEAEARTQRERGGGCRAPCVGDGCARALRDSQRFEARRERQHRDESTRRWSSEPSACELHRAILALDGRGHSRAGHSYAMRLARMHSSREGFSFRPKLD